MSLTCSSPVDVNECSYGELNTCSGRELCLNVRPTPVCGLPEVPSSSPRGWTACVQVSDWAFPGGEEGLYESFQAERSSDRKTLSSAKRERLVTEEKAHSSSFERLDLIAGYSFLLLIVVIYHIGLVSGV